MQRAVRCYDVDYGSGGKESKITVFYSEKQAKFDVRGDEWRTVSLHNLWQLLHRCAIGKKIEVYSQQMSFRFIRQLTAERYNHIQQNPTVGPFGPSDMPELLLVNDSKSQLLRFVKCVSVELNLTHSL